MMHKHYVGMIYRPLTGLLALPAIPLNKNEQANLLLTMWTQTIILNRRRFYVYLCIYALNIYGIVRFYGTTSHLYTIVIKR